jgi:hypothetical protein
MTEYSLTELLQGRGASGSVNKAYSVVYDKFLPCIVGRTKWKERLSYVQQDRELSTPTDEALCLLFLENYYDRWMDLYKIKNAPVEPVRGETKRVFKSDVPPKYTNGGITYNLTERRSHSGWSAEGIKRFNMYHDRVIQDRRMHPHYVVNFLKAKRDFGSVNKPGKKGSKNDDRPQAQMDAWESEDEDDCNAVTMAAV